MTTAVWFRSDLRMYDNPALHAALASGQAVVALYLFTPAQHQQHHVGPTKLRFMLESLVALKQDLQTLNIPLLAFLADDYNSSVELLTKLTRQHGFNSVHANAEVELNETRRDQLASAQLADAGAPLHLHWDQSILHPSTIKTGGDQPYRVFTPFKRAWLKRIQQHPLAVLPAPKAVPKPQPSKSQASTPDDEILSWQAPTPANAHWQAGSNAAYHALETFCNQRIEHYHSGRDVPSLDSTSRLSPHLAVGSLSLRTCMIAALRENRQEWDSGSQGALTWINELIWREFYKHLTYHYPDLSKGFAFNPKTAHIPWSHDQARFDQWAQGRTGFPLVDAGMRQLNQTGWMHNRLRMVTAMFLTKQLFIDWRLGEAYFMQHLIDGDYAANNGGWQWSASTGADAAPYFRVFNPTRQSERFDPQGHFLRQWVPELASINGKAIHNPSPMERQMLGYPMPMVDHAQSVEQVKSVFKEAQAMVASP